MHYDVWAATGPADIEVVCAFDVDQRKVGAAARRRGAGAAEQHAPALSEAAALAASSVEMGPVLDGVAEHMRGLPAGADASSSPSAGPSTSPRCCARSGAEIVVNYLPVGSQQATEHYARACLEAGVSLVNCIPVFIASDPQWAAEFERRGIPIVGDDIKSQVGATIVHRMLAQALRRPRRRRSTAPTS